MNAKKLLVLYVLEVLKKYSNSNHKLTQKDIINHIKREYNMVCERKAISRNISYLREFGYDIQTKADNGEGIVLLTREFENAELRLLIDSVYSSKFLSEQHSKILIDKLNKKSSKYFKNRTKHILPMKGHYKSHSATLFYNIDIIDEAIENKNKISFIYNHYGIDKKLHAKYKKKHVLNPYQIVINNSRYYLIGNMDKYNNLVNFRIDLITNIDIIRDSNIKPIYDIKGYENGLDLNKIIDESPYMFSGGTDNVVVKTKKETIGDIIDWFGEKISIVEINEQEIEVHFKANANAIRYWLLQYGLSLEVLAPERLRLQYIEDIKNIFDKYKNKEEKD